MMNEKETTKDSYVRVEGEREGGSKRSKANATIAYTLFAQASEQRMRGLFSFFFLEKARSASFISDNTKLKA